jgi:hypothetical protein
MAEVKLRIELPSSLEELRGELEKDIWEGMEKGPLGTTLIYRIFLKVKMFLEHPPRSFRAPVVASGVSKYRSEFLSPRGEILRVIVTCEKSGDDTEFFVEIKKVSN